jgi:hypothetical protein
MSRLLPVKELDDWFRTGRGHRFDFFATNEDVQEWLLIALQPAYAPFTLAGYHTVPFECQITEFMQCRADRDGTIRWNFWICSKMLTPELPLQPDIRLDKLCSLSGLVGLQHGFMRRVRNPRDPAITRYQAASSISVVAEVYNQQTGAVRSYPEYKKIFETLRRRIRRSLVYTTITRFADGSEREDPLLRMTQAAKDLYDQGHPFVNRPGRFIGQKRN